MAKRVYKAVRTSCFMPFDQGNRWVIEAPNGDIIHSWAGAGQGLRQNEAISGARELNAGTKTEEDFSK